MFGWSLLTASRHIAPLQCVSLCYTSLIPCVLCSLQHVTCTQPICPFLFISVTTAFLPSLPPFSCAFQTFSHAPGTSGRLGAGADTAPTLRRRPRQDAAASHRLCVPPASAAHLCLPPALPCCCHQQPPHHARERSSRLDRERNGGLGPHQRLGHLHSDRTRRSALAEKPMRLPWLRPQQGSRRREGIIR